MGKGITSVKNFVMDKTPLGSAIKWGRNKISEATNWFFDETWLGKKITKGIDMWNNSSIGKFVNQYVVPVAKAGSLLVGGLGLTGGVIGKCFTVAGNVASHYEKIKDVRSYVTDTILNNPLTNKLTGFI